MSLKQKLLDKIQNEKLRKAIENPATRARVLFAVGIVGTLAFVAFNAVAGVLYQSVWYGALAVYFIALLLQKIGVVLSSTLMHKKFDSNAERLLREQRKIYLANGVLLLVLNIALTASSILMALGKKPTKLHEIFAIANAAYAFFKITTAIINAVKTRKSDDVILQVIRNINLAAATVSMLALTSTMISTFGNPEGMHTMLTAVSVGTGAIITLLGIYMITKGALSLKNRPAAEANQTTETVSTTVEATPNTEATPTTNQGE